MQVRRNMQGDSSGPTKESLMELGLEIQTAMTL